MTDLTKVFKTVVKAIKLNLNINDPNETLNLKKKQKSKDQNAIEINFSKDALAIVQNITKLKNYLIENKQNYVQPNYLVSDNTIINDEERQKINTEAENIIQTCAETIRVLRQSAFDQILTQQQKNHLEGLFSIIEKYLKDVCKIYGEQRAIQVQRTIEIKNFSQICTPSIKNLIKTSAESKKRLKDVPDTNTNDSNIDKSLTSEEIQAFEQENNSLFDSLTAMSQEIKQIESQVIEISRLQQVFTEKILEQDSSIDAIQTTAAKTTDNIKYGNEEIQEAMKKNAALRLWILFIVIVLSFTLLFLDWYND